MLTRTRVWLLLMLLTLLALFMGKTSAPDGALMTLLLLTTLWKGQLIGDYFMGLQHSGWLWRGLIWGWLLLVAGGVGLAYRLTPGG